MSERTYGIPLGHVQGAQQTRTPESPGEAMGYTSHSGHDYRDAGNPYDSRMNTHSPGPYHDAYGPPSPPPHVHGPVSPIHQESQTSLAPLTENQAVGYSPSVSTNRSFQRNAPAMPGGAGAGLGAAGYGQSLPRHHSYYGDEYDSFDPSTIEDDGDDGIPAGSRSRNKLGFGAAAGAGAGAGVGMKAMDRGSSGLYGPVGNDAEKSEWLSKQTDRSSRKKKWIIGCTIAAILVIGGIVGGVVGGILANNKDENERGSSGGSSTVGSDSAGLYDLNSRQVQAVLNDDRLHRVFPTIDYTPWYAQYPACLSPGGGPTQNNVTLDIARLSQLAASVRLYGTDCNQTELVLEAIERLEMQDTMKVWLGVYLDGRNQTTNDRQLKDLYRILDNYPHDRFVGVIVGNEVLFQETMTVTELAAQLDEVRSNFSSRGINLPVATADLGDNWDADLAKASDIVMSNIHPFFAGTVAEDAAGWAWSFWQSKDVALTSSETGTVGSVTYPKQIISEIGWPTQGGNDCGVSSDPAFGCKSETDGAVASIENLNTFMDGWVCEALKNGTTFFWFEAFDEPWKHQFDTEHNKWEPYWGIFDKDRNLKKGIKIPDCGTSVAKPY